MMRKFKIPAWARIAMIFMAVSIFGTILSSIGELVVYPVLVFTLWLWPRASGKKPYLVAVFPWITLAEGVFALVLGVGGEALQRQLMGPEHSMSVGLSPAELAVGVLSTPVLLWTFWTRAQSAQTAKRFRNVLLAVTIVTVVTTFVVFDYASAGTKQWIELASGIIAEAALVACLWRNA